MHSKNHKSAVDILLTALVAAAAVALTWAGLRGSKDIAVAANASANSIELPDDAFVVVVDAGHGGFDGGATGSKTGVAEAELNLAVAKLLSSELTARGFYVVMTRETDEALAKTKSEDMRMRSSIMRLPEADIVVSIHMNKFDDSSVSGPMVFYMKNSAEGQALAECVITNICFEIGRPPRYSNPEDLFVLREPAVPSVLVECGFLSNAEDEAKLMDEYYRQEIARGIANGIADYAAALKHRDG